MTTRNPSTFTLSEIENTIDLDSELLGEKKAHLQDVVYELFSYLGTRETRLHNYQVQKEIAKIKERQTSKPKASVGDK